jgi:hypothetical protein
MKEMNFESYVLHTRHSSIVCVGQYDGPTDPKIEETIGLLGKLRSLNVQGADALQLNAQPLPMKIPRP